MATVNNVVNWKNGMKVVGTDGADFITNGGENVTIQANAGNDTVYGSENGELFLFASTHGKNVIVNFGGNDTLAMTDSKGTLTTAIKGEDAIVSIKGSKKTATVTLVGAGNLEFKQSGKNLTVDYVTEIENSDDGKKIVGTDGRDYIINTGENVTIQGGGGNDTIESSDFGEMFLFGASEGQDYITDFGENDTLKITSGSIDSTMLLGNDFVVKVKGTKYSGAVTLGGGASHIFKQSGKLLLVDAINSIDNTDDGQKIGGTDGRDYITNSGEKVTLDGKGGNDTLTGSDFGEMYLFAADGGQDLITNFGKEDTLKITSGDIHSSLRTDDELIINIKSTKYAGSITLKDVGDLRFKKTGQFITVDDVNQIVNRKNKKKVVGTGGNDFITNSGSKVTIRSGGGNDTLEGSSNGEMYYFGASDGNNVIIDFGKNDTLRCVSGTIKAIAAVGDDHVITLQGGRYSATVTLKNTADYIFKQNGKYITVADFREIINTSDGKKVVGTSLADYIINGGEDVTIQGGGGNDTVEGSEYGEMFLYGAADGNDTIINFGENDTIKLSSGSIDSTLRAGDDFIVNVKNSKHTGQLTLKNAAGYNFLQNGKLLIADYVNYIFNWNDGAKVNGTDGRDWLGNSGEHVTIASGGGNDTIEGSEFGEVFLFGAADGSDTITNFGENDTIKITSGNIQSTIAIGDDIIINVKNSTYIGSLELKNAREFNFVKDGNVLSIDPVNRIVVPVDNKKAVGTDGRDYIVNPGRAGVTIEGKGGNDTIESNANYGERFVFGALDGNDVILNFDAHDTLSFNYGTVQSAKFVGDDYVVTVASGKTNGTVTLKDTAGLTFRQKQNAVIADSVNTVRNSKNSRKVVGTNGADYIINSGNAVTISGGGGNDITEGSEYGEMFLYGAADGNDTITNFGSNDTLKITYGVIQSTLRSGDDVLFDVRNGIYRSTLMLKNAARYSDNFLFNENGITVDRVNYVINRDDGARVDGTSGSDYIINSGENVTIAGGGGNDTLEGSNFGEVFVFGAADGNDTIINFDAHDTLEATSGTISTQKFGYDMLVTVKSGKTIGKVTLKDAAAYTFIKDDNALIIDSVNRIEIPIESKKISGTDGKDYIVNPGYDGVTIEGKGGNDTIESNANYGEVFVFNAFDGNDVILNFDANDALSFNYGTIQSAKFVGDDYVVSVGGEKIGGTVTLKDVVGINFNLRNKSITADNVNSIVNRQSSKKIVGTGGNDYIVNTGDNVTIQAGGGNDTIVGSVLYGEMYYFGAADGLDYVTNFGKNDTLRITSGSIYSTLRAGNDFIVNVKSKSTAGSITLGGAVNYNFEQNGNYLTVDYVNYIVNNEDNKSVLGSDKRDYIVSNGENVTIESGGKNDTIEGSDFAETFVFNCLSGDNVITNFGVGDTLKATSGTLSTLKSGSDYVVTIANSSKKATVTLTGAADVGTVQFNTKKTAMILRRPVIISLEQPSEDYWFTEDEAMADASCNEVDALMSEAAIDNALGKQTFNSDPSEILTSLEGVSKLDRTLAMVGRHKTTK